MSAWRWRRCPRCGVVRPAASFALAQGYGPGWRASGTMRRRCPGCGHRAPTAAFAVVRGASAVRSR